MFVATVLKPWQSLRGKRGIIQICWYDPESRQTRTRSTGTTHFRAAQQALHAYAAERNRPRDAAPADVALTDIWSWYWADHLKDTASGPERWFHLRLWDEWWQHRLVSDLTPDRQMQFRAWLEAGGTRGKPYSAGYVRTVMGTGRAALRHAYQWQRLAAVPHIFMPETPPPLEYVATDDEILAFMEASAPHVVTYCWLMLNAGRPVGTRKLTWEQIDLGKCRIQFLPDGAKQTKKRLPTVPLTPTVRDHLMTLPTPRTGPVLLHNGKAVDRIPAWRRTRIRLGLPKGFTPRGLRHTAATRMGEAGVDRVQINYMLGHKMPDTSERYIHLGPDWLAEASHTLEEWHCRLTPDSGSSLTARGARAPYSMDACSSIEHPADTSSATRADSHTGTTKE